MRELMRRLHLVEIFAAITVVVSVLTYGDRPGQADYLMIITLGVLATLYFLKAFGRPGDKSAGTMESFILKLVYWSWSVCAIGILFMIQGFPGGDMMLFVGLLTLLAALAVSLIFKIRMSDISVFSRSFYIRSIILLFICGALYLLPPDRLEKAGIIKVGENSNEAIE